MLEEPLMILDNPLAGQPLRTLRSFIPQPELPPTMRQLDESKAPTRNAAKSSFENETNGKRPSAFVEAVAVRLFGGVIIGAGALDISRSFGHQRRAIAPPDETESDDSCDNEADYDREPLVECYSAAVTAPSTAAVVAIATAPSPAANAVSHLSLHETGQASSTAELLSKGAECECPTPAGSADDGGLFVPKRAVTANIGKKRKFIGQVDSSSGISPGVEITESGRVVTADATPVAPAPGGRAAARAKAEGQGCTVFVSECQLPTERGLFRLRAYRFTGKEKLHEPVVMVVGDLRGRENVPVRVHDQCQTSEVLGSKRCDCREQLDLSLRYIQEQGGGAVIYLQQEGRGIGLANKVAAYALQDDGLDTVDANRKLGFKDDQRSYECIDFILRDMGIKSIHLMTNNPYKIEWLRATGVVVSGRIPVQVPSNKHNVGYLEAKAARMSHLINNL